MNKGERISRFVQSLEAEAAKRASTRIASHPYYCAFFRCWNEQRYYEAHDVLEQVWLHDPITPEDAQYFKGLIQAAGAFVHLQKQFEHPTHPKHGKRLGPAVRLFRLAEKNLAPFGEERHDLDLAKFRDMLVRYREAVEAGAKNPWTPKTAPAVRLRENQFAAGQHEHRRKND
jgi:predicted metal-dependent hydrolase